MSPSTPRLEPFHYEVATEIAPDMATPTVDPTRPSRYGWRWRSPGPTLMVPIKDVDDHQQLRLGAWYGADPLVPMGSRRYLQVMRRALDLTEIEMGRSINLIVWGTEGPEGVLLCAEEGVGGLTQDPPTSVDGITAVGIMAAADMLWVGSMTQDAPENLAHQGVWASALVEAGLRPAQICVSVAPSRGSGRLDLPYILALRSLFAEYRVRCETEPTLPAGSLREATVAQLVNRLVAGVAAVDLISVGIAEATRGGAADLQELPTQLRPDLAGELGAQVRDFMELAVLRLEEMEPVGGGSDDLVLRDDDYFAPVCAHMGYNNLAMPGELGLPQDAGPAGVKGGFGSRLPVSAGEGYAALGRQTKESQGEREALALPAGRPVRRRPCTIIRGCTLCEPTKVAD